MKPTRFMFLFRLTVVLFMTIALFWAGSAFADDAKTLANVMKEHITAASMKEKCGIEVAAIHISAAGNMVDFRYKVLDAEKAAALFSKKTKPYLIHQKTGKVLAVPRTAKVGPLMSSYHPKQDRIYWMFFGNQTRLVQKGDKVTVVIGDFKAENLIVE
jgi:hypothetical protein